MRTARFTEEKMVQILREADQHPVATVAKKYRISDQTIDLWRKRFGQLEPVELGRMGALDTENGWLKKLVAERDPELEVMKESPKKSGERGGAPTSCCLCPGPRQFPAASMRTAVRCVLDARLQLATG